MPKVPKIVVKNASANVKSAEVAAVITVGPKSAALLSKQLGREVKVGEQFDIGAVSYYNSNPFKRVWGTLRVIARQSKNPFRKPLA